MNELINGITYVTVNYLMTKKNLISIESQRRTSKQERLQLRQEESRPSARRVGICTRQLASLGLRTGRQAAAAVVLEREEVMSWGALVPSFVCLCA